MVSRSFLITHKILVKSSEIAIKEIVKKLSETKDPIVRIIALRRWAGGYGLPKNVLRYAGEFIALGNIYRGSKGVFSRDPIPLTKHQNAMLKRIFREAIIWTYKYWSPPIMARVIVRGGGFEEMENNIREYRLARNMHKIPSSMYYRRLLIIFNEGS